MIKLKNNNLMNNMLNFLIKLFLLVFVKFIVGVLIKFEKMRWKVDFGYVLD